MLTLNQFTEFYAQNSDMPKTKAKEEITRFIENFKTATVENGGVDINGFIKSEIKDKKAREGVNPRTKERIMIPAKKHIKVFVKPSFAKMLED